MTPYLSPLPAFQPKILPLFLSVHSSFSQFSCLRVWIFCSSLPPYMVWSLLTAYVLPLPLFSSQFTSSISFFLYIYFVLIFFLSLLSCDYLLDSALPLSPSLQLIIFPFSLFPLFVLAHFFPFLRVCLVSIVFVLHFNFFSLMIDSSYLVFLLSLSPSSMPLKSLF